MKIAIISNNFFKYDAIGRYIYLITKAFPQAQFDIYLETKTDFKNLEERIKIYPYFFLKRCPCLGWYLLEWKIEYRIKIIEQLFLVPLRRTIIALLAHSLLKKNYDFIWLQWGLYFNGLSLFKELSQRKRRPFLIFDYHGTTPPQFIQSAGKKMIAQRSLTELKEAANQADLCLVRSNFIKQELKEYAHPQRIKTLHLPLFLNKSRSRKEKHLKKKKEVIKLLYVGRIAPHKNLEVVIRALPYLKKYKISFEIIGSFSRPSLKREKERLEKLVYQLKLQQQVHFRGTVSTSSLEQYYQTTDIFIIPSLHEGFSWPTVEALKWGKPVLYAQRGALPEIIGSAGLEFKPLQPRELAKKIKVILENPFLRDKLERRALQRAKKFSWRRFKKKLKLILKESKTY